MKISLVIPVHNLEKHIEPLLVSLKFQNYDHEEIEPIFICDACEDRTHEIIEDYLAGSFPALRILDRNYRSSGLGRNDGLELASGKYIWLLDGDDWLIDNHAISKVLAYFEARPDAEVLRVNWLSNNFGVPNYPFTVWQWIQTAERAKAVKFTSRKYDDDVEWVKAWMLKFDFLGCDTLASPLYFYNYMREGSVMQKRLTEEKNNGLSCDTAGRAQDKEEQPKDSKES